MLTNRFTAELLTRRRRSRRSRPNSRPRGTMRRGWLVQRLEPRCVMAADLGFSESADLFEDDPSLMPEWTEQVVRAEQTRERTDNFLVDLVVDPTSNQDELVVAGIDLLDPQPAQFVVKSEQVFVLSMSSAQLDGLLGQSQSLELHVLYDASQWQPAFDDMGTLSANDLAYEQFAENSSPAGLRFLSLFDQSVLVETEVLTTDGDAGVDSQIAIRLRNAGSWSNMNDHTAGDKFATQSQSTSETTAAFDIVSGIPRYSSDAGPSGLPSIEAGIKDNFDGDVPGTTTVGDQPSEAQPLNDVDATPLPEPKRESFNRTPRTSRRSLDIRSTASAYGSWSSSSTANSRPTVTRDSLVTQNAIASAYDEQVPSPAGPSRWMLEPKPARLQVATFLIKRSEVSHGATAFTITQSTSASEPIETQPPTDSIPLTQATSRSQMESDEESVHVSSLPAEGDVTAIQPTLLEAVSIDSASSTEEKPSEAMEENALYAIVVDRLFGSPISLAAVLGLTVVARFTESEEGLQQHL